MVFNKKLYLSQYYQKNKKKIDARNRVWQQTNKDKVYLYDIKRSYGLSKEGLESLSKLCEICGGDERLAIDHCHKTNKVRGRLCKSCNSAIGLFKENKENLVNAIKYLGKHNDLQ